MAQWNESVVQYSLSLSLSLEFRCLFVAEKENNQGKKVLGHFFVYSYGVYLSYIRMVSSVATVLHGVP